MERKLMNNELNRLSEDNFKLVDKNKIILVADNLRSALNIGSLFRTADAFLLQEILLVGISATPPNKELIKTALGAERTVIWQHFTHTPDAISYLRSHHALICCLEQVTHSISLEKFTYDKSRTLALVAGSEIGGVSDEWIAHSDYCIEIPQWGSKHSLNVSVAAGIALWQLLIG